MNDFEAFPILDSLARAIHGCVAALVKPITTIANALQLLAYAACGSVFVRFLEFVWKKP